MRVQILVAMSRKLSSWVVMYALLMLLALYLAGCASAGHSGAVTTHTMTLSHHEFAAVDFVPQAGEKILIINGSDIAHSIYVTYPDGNVVNLGVQLPGAKRTWVIPKGAQGEFLLQCWIHPIIRAQLFVNVTHVSSSVSSSIPTSSALTSQEIFNGRQNICSSRNRRT
ncbi:MAG: methylamine utilization protein [Methylophilus sp.]|uniref:methylamine utilization protein n=1 Tax=Methylophilus sp. TaxID=29541 RepID=UPI003FA12ADC